MTEADVLDAFYNTGRADMERLDQWLARSRATLPATSTCAEYGCGVGRCTIWLARRYAHVRAFDISEPHLRLAEARVRAEGLKNVEFVHVRSEVDLRTMDGFDFFYSVMVPQHNPPPLILSILKHAFRGLRPCGAAYFQVPTYAEAYSFGLQEYLERAMDLGMEMHFVPQHAIFDLARAEGIQPLEVSPDDLIGNAGRWISSSFLMTKRSSLGEHRKET